MNEAQTPSAAPAAPQSPPPTTPSQPASDRPLPAAAVPIGWVAVAALLALLSLAALGLVWSTQERVRTLEEALVKRQQISQDQATEARVAAKQAQDVARESAARVAVMELRVAESTLQRSQVEELMQTVARSRDESVLADVEAALRVAMQQSAITGGAEPLLYALKQADERLARFNEPRLERVREAIRADIELAQSVAIADLATLTKRLDDAMRLVDLMPLLSRPDPRGTAAASPGGAPGSQAQSATVSTEPQTRWDDLARSWDEWTSAVWGEIRGLVRVTPIDQPEAMLIAPDQSFFLRENLKLRLLNARLALLSRQFDTAHSDLRDARLALTRYFDGSAASVQKAQELVQLVAAQARQVAVPRPDASLAAIAAATPRR